MSDLKPCPFCGSDGNDLDFRFVYATKFTKPFLLVGCRKCGGMMVDTNTDHCLNDVKKAWNRRANDDIRRIDVGNPSLNDSSYI